jgi:hypothetical protein
MPGTGSTDEIRLERLVNYAAFITDTTTGETRRYQLDATTPYGEGSRFWWAEGNFSCDCNRGPCFQRAGGVPEDALDWEIGCSLNRARRYRVSHLELDDGTRVEIDTVEDDL